MSPSGTFGRSATWAGAGFLLMASLFLVLIVLSGLLTGETGALSPQTPLTPQDLLSLAGHAELARATFGLGMISDLVLIFATVALYRSLGRLDREVMLLAVSFLGIYALMDLFVTGTNAASLVAVAQGYAASPTGPSSPEFGAAVYIRGVLAVSLPLSSAALSVGILLVGWTVRAGPFGRVLPVLSAVAGTLGLLYGLSVVAPALTGFIAWSAFGELAWFAVLGASLLRWRPALAEPASALPAPGHGPGTGTGPSEGGPDDGLPLGT